jgi:Zn-dependent protease
MTDDFDMMGGGDGAMGKRDSFGRCIILTYIFATFADVVPFLVDLPPTPLSFVFFHFFLHPVARPYLPRQVHEFGHALTTKKLGGTVDGIVLWPLGGFALCGPVDALVGDLKVALMGPMTHVPMSAFWWMLYAILRDGDRSGLWPNATIYLDVLSTPAG